MAKASSPIRLQSDLMQLAELTASRHHRSVAEQIEYWADLGLQVASVLDPDTLLSITSGLATIHVEQVHAKPVSPVQVCQKLETDREAGVLAASVSRASVRYQVSEEHPGYLEQIDSEGRISTGSFENGEFIPLDKSDS